MTVLIISDNESTFSSKWINALERIQADYVCSKIEEDWNTKISQFKPNIVIGCPNSFDIYKKRKYDEIHLQVLKNYDVPIYPDFKAIKIYENKPELQKILVENDIPHPKTYYYTEYEKGLDYIFNESKSYPIIAKSNSGAGGVGIKFLRNKIEAEKLVYEVFKGRGFPKRIGPNLRQGNKLSRTWNKITNPGVLLKKLNAYRKRYQYRQKGEILFQEFIPHEYEWRVVRIGESYFAHKKIAESGMASGSKLKGYENPPLSVLQFVKEISDKLEIKSAAYDLFETSDGKYLVNEIQTYFGQSDPYQMLIDGKPARYVYRDNNWISEFGDFARNQCYDLRLKYALDMAGIVHNITFQ
ncbi:hypothetical protein DYD21_10500 [Rhodohalobacter sp. SW132]|uniref:ATP-grasp domain-containing protein n=1 Tax=Rhodohalobacter sp. SW132 TaxID=2293433 RepID=UPI000E22A87D|nr:hypothetical protein [Rhodohalobacter sp. SW132]REL33826.1 hypothetical protein DYD21_10500 [Rhodohalobacter sp. SW132]